MFWSTASYIQQVNHKWLFYYLNGAQTMSSVVAKNKYWFLWKWYGHTVFIIQRVTDLWCCCCLWQSTILSPKSVTSSAAYSAMVKMSISTQPKLDVYAPVNLHAWRSYFLRLYRTMLTEFRWRSCSHIEYSNATRRHFVELCLTRVRCLGI